MTQGTSEVGMAHNHFQVSSTLTPASRCPHGDPLCPCQDGDSCHYEGKDPMSYAICPCGHGIYWHEDYDGEIHECNFPGCRCPQYSEVEKEADHASRL